MIKQQQEKQKKIDNFAIKKIVDGIVILDNEHAYAPPFIFIISSYILLLYLFKKKINLLLLCVFF